jgi:hypothetical protein
MGISSGLLYEVCNAIQIAASENRRNEFSLDASDSRLLQTHGMACAGEQRERMQSKALISARTAGCDQVFSDIGKTAL